MNNKYLLAIFGVLLACYFLSKMVTTKTDRSFKTELVSIDTASVTKIVLNTKVDQHETVTLEKSGSSWQVTKGGQSNVADAAAIGALLSQMVLVKTKRVAAKSEEKWTEYEVDEKGGNRVKIYAGDQLLSDFVVGRFTFNQTARTATTFMRLSDAPDIYAVDGFLSMSFGQGYNAYRPRELVKIRMEDITGITWQNGTQTSQFIKNGNTWTDGNGQALDSTKVAGYLNSLSNSNGSDFVDDFAASSFGAERTQRLTINGNNSLSPIVLTAYQTGNPEQAYVIQSSQNPSAYFSSKEDGIYKTIFSAIQELK